MARLTVVSLTLIGMFLASPASAQDWPQWRGVNRDGKADFKAPDKWPAELTEKWSVSVGNGVSTPALVGDRLYVFTRVGGEEVIRCMDAGSGEVKWETKYETPGVSGFGSTGFPGPRSSPAVADGKVVTLGLHAEVCCLDAESGEMLWRKNDLAGNEPMFQTSSSPIIVDGKCIVQLGGARGRGGAIIAYDMASGDEAWRWNGDGAAYASPIKGAIADVEIILAVTAGNMAVLGATDGKQYWMEGYGQGRYNATTPMIVGDTVVYAGLGVGMTREKLVPQEGEAWTSEIVWANEDNSLQFNSPVLKEGMLYGLSNQDQVFCINVESGKTAWSAPLGAARAQGGGRPPAGGGGGGRQRRGGGGAQAGYGSIVDAGSAMFGLTPAGELVVFAPSETEFQKLASYRVAEANTYAYPIISGNRIFIKDTDNLTLWTVE